MTTILLQPPTYILLELRIILISLIIYKPSTLIISSQTFNTQLGAGTSLFCLSQCTIPFCTLSVVTTALVLVSFQDSEPFCIEADSSNFTSRAVLSQQLPREGK